jgi:hypothetical protein
MPLINKSISNLLVDFSMNITSFSVKKDYIVVGGDSRSTTQTHPSFLKDANLFVSLWK